MDTKKYTAIVEEILQEVAPQGTRPEGLYAPIRYALSMGGKRLRPVLMLLAYRLFVPEGDLSPLYPAMKAIEVFHNFTLLHDDLMDDAPVRRGLPTVYRKWDANTAILSGDAMLIAAYQELSHLSDEHFRQVYDEFGRMALEVCEGQQYDMDFEDRSDVTIAEYLEMIRLKTACLIASAFKIGAILAGQSEEVLATIYQVGEEIGLAFQLVDDYLDAFADKGFGKRRGGDILEEKKTWLLLRAEAEAKRRRSAQLSTALSIKDESERIEAVIQCYRDFGVAEELQVLVREYSTRAIDKLRGLSLDEDYRREVITLVEQLTVRTI